MKGNGGRMEDAEIISRFFERDEQAISETSAKYGKLLNTIAVNILSDSADAEECVNDTYMKLWNVIPPYRPTHFRSFVCRMTRQIAIDKLRSENREKRPQMVDSPIDELDIACDAEIEDESGLTDAINEFLASLPIEGRTLFVRRYFLCEPLASLAERFGMTENAVSVKLFRIREKLKKHLIRKGYSI